MLAPAPSAAEPVAPSHPIGGDGRVALGAASALAAHADVAPVVVRLGFLVLTVAAGIGIPLYGVAWLLLVWRQEPPTRPVPSHSGDQRRTLAIALIVAGMIAVARTRIDSVPDRLVWPAGVVALGLAFLWPRLDTGRDAAATLARAGVLRVLGALILVAGGLGSVLAANLSYETVRDGLAAALFVVVGTLLLFAPWLYRLIESLGEERRQRVRADERAAVAAHLHDSVLQTLTLIQKRAEDPRAMSALARHQERELRRWLYEPASTVEGDSLQAALEAMVSGVETDHLVSIDNVTVGDVVMDDRTTALVAATREALVNAAKFAGTRSVSLYARTTSMGSEVFVRDRGIGFELDKVPADRHGIRESIVGRLARVGGAASIRTTPGEGTEIHLEVPRVTRPRVVIVDDHHLIRSGVTAELADHADVVGEGVDVDDGVATILRTKPDVVLLDVHLPSGNGAAVIQQVAAVLPEVRFLALSVSDAPDDVLSLVRAGARGYVTKNIPGGELAEAVVRVLAGDAVFSPRLAGFVLDAFGPAAPEPTDPELDLLTPREDEVMQLLARGYTYKEIAGELTISIRTVESHASAVLRKLQLTNRHALTRWAARRRIL